MTQGAPTHDDLAALSGEGVSILKDAIVNQYQAILAGGAIVASVAGFSPLPLLIWLGAEMIFLPLIDTPPVRRWLMRKKREKDREDAKVRRAEIVNALDSSRKEAYRALETICHKIELNYRGISGVSQFYIREQQEKMNSILNGCLQRLVALSKYEAFQHHQRDERELQNEIKLIEKSLNEPGHSERVKTALQNNLQLKRSLLSSQHDASQTKIALAAELDSLSSLLELLHQKSLSIRDPQEISNELDAIVTQVSDTDQSIREMEALMAAGSDKLSAPIDPIPAIGGGQPQASSRAARRLKNL
jgi:hypothetical protein